MQTSEKLKILVPERTGTPYRELHSSIIFGLLAHSHSWCGSNPNPKEMIARLLRESDNRHISHPRYSLDILCVANLAAWSSTKTALVGPFRSDGGTNDLVSMFGTTGKPISVYSRQRQPITRDEIVTPIGMLISYLSMRIAWEDPSLRDLANYYRAVNIGGDGGGEYRKWPITIYSDEVRSLIKVGKLHTRRLSWDGWNRDYF